MVNDGVNGMINRIAQYCLLFRGGKALHTSRGVSNSKADRPRGHRRYEVICTAIVGK